MTWNSGPCITSGDRPSDRTRQAFAAREALAVSRAWEAGCAMRWTPDMREGGDPVPDDLTNQHLEQEQANANRRRLEAEAEAKRRQAEQAAKQPKK